MKVTFNEQNWQKLQRLDTTYSRELAQKNRGSRLQIPSRYQFIGDKAMCNNMQLRVLELPKHCAIIGNSAFEGTRIEEELRLPATMKVIGRRAFAHNAHLSRMTIPKSVRRIGEGAFRECKRLQEVQFEKKSELRLLRAEVFDSCIGLESICLPERLLVVERRAFYRCKQLRSVTFPGTISRIGEEAFYFNRLEELQLPDSLLELGDSAFFKCRNLKQVTIPAGVGRIGRWVFHGCDRLEVLEILHDPAEIGEWIINRSAVIRCRYGSKVDLYCQEYGFKTVYV